LDTGRQYSSAAYLPRIQNFLRTAVPDTVVVGIGLIRVVDRAVIPDIPDTVLIGIPPIRTVVTGTIVARIPDTIGTRNIHGNRVDTGRGVPPHNPDIRIRRSGLYFVEQFIVTTPVSSASRISWIPSQMKGGLASPRRLSSESQRLHAPMPPLAVLAEVYQAIIFSNSRKHLDRRFTSRGM
jgi:hypothetical protein